MSFITETIFGILGGLGLFIYGMQRMTDGLQTVAGDRLKGIMESFTSNRLKGVFVGAGITAVIQSSSVTTTMLVGFVNAGILTLTQAVSVVLGANIGTTITAQIISLKIDKLALPAIAIGFALNFLGRRSRIKNIGMILMGFGMLFLGLTVMKDSVKFLRNSQWAIDTLVNFSENPLLGILAGVLVTVAVQSSSASIGLLLSLAAGGLISINAAIPILLGDNIGTCITALLASIGANTSARRTAVAHTLFNIIGTIIVLLLLPIYKEIVLLTSSDISRQIANAHTLFNVVNTIIFFPLMPYLIIAVEKIVPGDQDEKTTYLDERLLITPALAIEQVKSEIDYMGKTTAEMFDLSSRILTEKKFDLETKVLKRESIVDLLQREITDYLVRLSQKKLTVYQSRIYSAYMHIIGDLERIGDHSENLSKLNMKIIDSKNSLSPEAGKEISQLTEAAREFLNKTLDFLAGGTMFNLNGAYVLEDNIDIMVHRIRKHHINRLNEGNCSVVTGLIFMDMLHNFEKIGDHSLNICQQIEEELLIS